MKGIIKLCYRKVIDINSTKAWEKLVFSDSYAEFLLQAQTFNQEKRYSTYGELVSKVAGADKLSFLVSGAITGYLQQLNGKIPDLTNNLVKQFLPFHQFMFELINSDISDKTKHQVAINFYSAPLHWHDTVGSFLLLSIPGEEDGGAALTELFSIPPFVSIYSLQTVNEIK